MKRSNKLMIIICVVLAAGFLHFKQNRSDAGGDSGVDELRPIIGSIQKSISTTGTIEPQNRLEINVPISGRIEKIMVREGQMIKAGEILALMSSTERAALMDAAVLQGEKEVKYWEDVYKMTPLIAPIDGQVIVRAVEPGQTITTSDAIIVISDRLIVKADVDETDIGQIKIGQKALVGLDAYDDVTVSAEVDHISFESELVNNVNIYSVDILPVEIPTVFRSGMSANVEVVIADKTGVVLLPVKAIVYRDGNPFVLIKNDVGDVVSVPVKIGIQSGDMIEILEGISSSDIVLIKNAGSLERRKQDEGVNPFMPNFKKRKKG